MNSKKNYIISILLAISFVFANAQQGGNNPQRGLSESETLQQREDVQNRSMTREEAEQMIKESIRQTVDKMAELLSLTSDQATKIYAIEVELNNIRSEKIGKVMSDFAAQQKITKEMIVLGEEKYKTVLTADQFSKLQEYNRPVLNFLNRFNP